MPTIREDTQALDFLAAQPNHPASADVAKKLGATPEDIKAWKYVQQNPEGSKNYETAIKVKNTIFEKIANNRVADQSESGVSARQRIELMNLIDREPKLQAEYLQKRGYEVRFEKQIEKGVPAKLTAGGMAGFALPGTEYKPEKVESVQLQVRKPGDTAWRPVDPKGLDLFDVTDVMSDVLQGVATTAGEVAGTALGGPLAGIAGAGIAGGLYETAKQGLGQAVGAREGFNVPEIGKEAALSAIILPTTRGAGKVANEVSDLRTALSGIKVAENAPEVFQAANKLKVPVTPAMVTDSDFVRVYEDIAKKEAGFIGSAHVRSKAEKIQEGVKKVVSTMFKTRSNKTRVATGETIEPMMLSKIEAKLKPVEEVYQRAEQRLTTAETMPDVSGINESLVKFSEKYRYDKGLMKEIEALYETANQLKTLDDLKAFRTAIGTQLETIPKTGSGKNPTLRHVLGTLYGDATEARTKTLLDLAENNTVPHFQEEWKQLAKDIRWADAEYKSAVDDVTVAFMKRGRRAQGNPMKVAEQFFADTEEAKRITKILKMNDPKQIEQLANRFPEAFSELKAGKVQQIYDASLDPHGKVSVAKLFNNLKKLDQESINLIFPRDQVENIAALKTILQSEPSIVNPSGTARTFKAYSLLSWFSQLSTAVRQAYVEARQAGVMQSDITRRFARNLEEGLYVPYTGGKRIPGGLQTGIYAGTRSILPRPEEDSSFSLPKVKKQQ